MASTKKVTLKSSDGEIFEVEEAVAVESRTIKHAIEFEEAGGGIPVPNVTGKILSKVIEYCKKHVDLVKDNEDDRAAEDERKTWDADFVKVDQSTLFHLIEAASYLDINSLLHLTCRTVADEMRGNSPQELRRIFNIKNDFTPEEEEERIKSSWRSENEWSLFQ